MPLSSGMSGAHDRNKYTRGNNKILNKTYGLYNIHGNSIWEENISAEEFNKL